MQTNIKHTAESLELYSDMEGADLAALHIGAVLDIACRDARQLVRGIDVDDGWDEDAMNRVGRLLGGVYEEVYRVLEQYADFGACDTEPRYHVKQALIDAAKETLGLGRDYYPELGDWML